MVRRSCAAIELEMGQIQSELHKLVPESDKIGKHLGLGVSGFFFLGIPWPFMDFSDAGLSLIKTSLDKTPFDGQIFFQQVRMVLTSLLSFLS